MCTRTGLGSQSAEASCYQKNSSMVKLDYQQSSQYFAPYKPKFKISMRQCMTAKRDALQKHLRKNYLQMEFQAKRVFYQPQSELIYDPQTIRFKQRRAMESPSPAALKELIDCQPNPHITQDYFLFLQRLQNISSQSLKLLCFYSDRFSFNYPELPISYLLEFIENAVQRQDQEIMGLGIWFASNYMADGGNCHLDFRSTKLCLYAANCSTVKSKLDEAVDLINYALQFQLDDNQKIDILVGVLMLCNSQRPLTELIMSSSSINKIVRSVNDFNKDIRKLGLNIIVKLSRKGQKYVLALLGCDLLPKIMRLLESENYDCSQKVLKILINLTSLPYQSVCSLKTLSQLQFSGNPHSLVCTFLTNLILNSPSQLVHLIATDKIVQILTRMQQIDRVTLSRVYECWIRLWKLQVWIDWRSVRVGLEELRDQQAMAVLNCITMDQNYQN